jgi:hypothetical protein
MWLDLAAQQGPKFDSLGSAGFAGGMASYQARTTRDEMGKQMTPAKLLKLNSTAGTGNPRSQ